MGKYIRKGRGILSPQQSQQVIDSIRKIQIGTEGLSKKAVVRKAFEQTFGEEANWPIRVYSSSIDRYWRLAFPSEKVQNLAPKGERRKRSPQPLLDDLRAHKEPIKVDESNTQVHMCPKCHCRFAVTIFEG